MRARAGRQRRRRRGVRGRGPVGVGAQGRARERRAQPRQVARRHASTSASGAATPARSDFSRAALEQTVRAAYDIARFTAEDPAAGLPDAARPGHADEAARDLDLFHPWAIDAAGAAELARRCEAAALATDRRITNSEGAGVSAQQSHFLAGNTRGFRGGYASSRHSLSVAPIAGRGRRGMQRDAWYSSMRDAAELAAPEAVGPLRRRARAVAPDVAQDRHLRGAGAVRVAARRRACSAPTCRPPAAARCTARRASCSTAWASRCCPSTSTSSKTRTCRKRQGQRAVRRRRRAHAARARWSRPAWCRATSCRATRRASSACAPPATPAARRT